MGRETRHCHWIFVKKPGNKMPPPPMCVCMCVCMRTRAYTCACVRERGLEGEINKHCSTTEPLVREREMKKEFRILKASFRIRLILDHTKAITSTSEAARPVITPSFKYCWQPMSTRRLTVCCFSTFNSFLPSYLLYCQEIQNFCSRMVKVMVSVDICNLTMGVGFKAFTFFPP